MKRLLSTKEVARLLGVNEKMVYTLIAEKGLPATKLTGKWGFPETLVEQWVENQTLHCIPAREVLPAFGADQGLLLAAGSNDILFERTMTLFMRQNPDSLALFGNVGSLGGLQALGRGQCHLATSHLAHADGKEYNFSFASEILAEPPAVVNFSLREQGLVLAPGNPKRIRGVADLGQKGLRVVNRPAGTGTRLLFDRELAKAGIEPNRLKGYEREFSRHLDVGLEVFAGRADVGPAIRVVAGLLNLDFFPLQWERFDLLIAKRHFFARGVQAFLETMRSQEFRALAAGLPGYDVSRTGKMLFPPGEQEAR